MLRAMRESTLTAHLFTPPRGEWIGFDTTVCFSQILTLRPSM